MAGRDRLDKALESILFATELYFDRKTIDKRTYDGAYEDFEDTIRSYQKDPAHDHKHVEEITQKASKEIGSRSSIITYDESQQRLLVASDQLFHAYEALLESAQAREAGDRRPAYDDYSHSQRIQALGAATTAFDDAMRMRQAAIEAAITYHGETFHNTRLEALANTPRKALRENTEALLTQEAKALHGKQQASGKDQYVAAFKALKTAQHYQKLAEKHFQAIKEKGYWSISKTYKTAKKQFTLASDKVKECRAALQAAENQLQEQDLNAHKTIADLHKQHDTVGEKVSHAAAAADAVADTALLAEYIDQYDELILATVGYQDALDKTKQMQAADKDNGTHYYRDNRAAIKAELADLKGKVSACRQRLGETAQQLKARQLFPDALRKRDTYNEDCLFELRDTIRALDEAKVTLNEKQQEYDRLATHCVLVARGGEEPQFGSLAEDKLQLAALREALEDAKSTVASYQDDYTQMNAHFKAIKSFKQQRKTQLGWRKKLPQRSSSDSQLAQREAAASIRRTASDPGVGSHSDEGTDNGFSL